jgi:LPS sulfotransferase NodH
MAGEGRVEDDKKRFSCIENVEVSRICEVLSEAVTVFVSRKGKVEQASCRTITEGEIYRTV